MCGILGVVGKINDYAFKNCLDTIAHRGPDGWGIWSDDDATIGHRRLSIIDLSDNAKQPMHILDRYVLTYNGEIYNYKEIRTELKKKGIHFFSQSDTEVLLYSYKVWGSDCVHKFNGMWAFAIWDREEKTLFLSRDRIGKKPLFYTTLNNRFVFASEMKALYPLLPSMNINYTLVEKAKKNVFCYESTDECLIKGIKRFPAGSNGIYKNGELKIDKFWHPMETLQTVSKRYEEQVEQFRELFIDACRLRMRSDVPLGTALSGGLDSSATICTMAHIANHTQGDFARDWKHAFVASFPGSFIDETKYAKEVVAHLNIPATYLPIDPLKGIGQLDYYTYLFEELYLTTPIPFFQLYGEVKKQGTTVTLDGHGSDELFGGYFFDFIKKLQDDFPNPLDMYSTLRAYMDSRRDPYTFASAWRHTLYHYRTTLKQKTFGKATLLKNKLDALNSQLYTSTFETILPTLLRNYDRYSMSNGVEIRMPFLDHRIISFAFSIPASSKIRNGFSKAIVRDAMKDMMPQSITYRKDKIGFTTPFAEWIRGSLKQWVQDIMHSREFNESAVICPKEVKASVNAVINAECANHMLGETAWISLMPFFWEKSLKHATRLSSDSAIHL